MELFFEVLFYSSTFVIIWAMIGYPLSLKIISKAYKSKIIKKNYSHQPTLTIMVVAHNEEKVILDKLNNIIELDYPKDKIKFLISSDNSTDRTNEIIKKFIANYPNLDIRLYEVKARMGKTNAQNEAQKTVTTEYLVMTDANSMMHRNAVKELMAAFTSDDIVYVTGRLSIMNKEASNVSSAEASYWDSDLASRKIESRIQTITAGNGALYACRNTEYHDFELIKSHDSSMPLHYALEGKRAIANHDALAFEKASVVIEDEFGRKVRMNRMILNQILPDIRILNIFKYKWFTYFYLGHRTCRYLLWISHFILLVSSALLSKVLWLYMYVFIGQVFFYLLALLQRKIKSQNKILVLTYYYTVTIIAQWVGVYQIFAGKAKPFWEKAESTR